MNLINIFSDIEAQRPEAADKFSFIRRKLLKTTAFSVVGTTSFLATTMQKAFADDGTVVDVLNFALTLEYLEAEFYANGLNRAGFVPAEDQMVLKTIGEHEQQHVAFLRTALGGNARPKPSFDFTAKGMFPSVFTNYQTFLTLAQSFEDLGVRAYKGQAPRLKGNRDVLLSALKIHSVEARHAAEIRLIRGLRVWTSEQETGGASQAVYMGENQTMQGGVDLPPVVSPKLIMRAGDIGMTTERTVREAYDEPLTKEQVLAIAGPFIAG